MAETMRVILDNFFSWLGTLILLLVAMAPFASWGGLINVRSKGS
jgi:hypothetical protein